MINSNIIRQEFKMHRRSIISWSLALFGIIVVFMAFFQVFAEEAVLMSKLMDNFPKELRTAFGINETDLSTILGYFSFIFLFIQLCLAVQASNYGVGLVSIEENELTADFLLTKPVSRLTILLSKFLAACASLMLTNLVVWVVSFFSIEFNQANQPYEPTTLLLLLLSLVIFEFFFLALGMTISLLVKRVRSVIPFSLALAFGAYVLNAFGSIFGDVKLELITPFKHLDPGYIIQNGNFNTPLTIANIAISIFCVAISIWLYLHRDITSAS